VRPEDAELLFAIRLRSLSTDPGAFSTTYEQEVARGIEPWKARATSASRDPHHATFLARDGDEVVGLATMIPCDEPGATELVGMWVAPEVRRGGFGRELIDACLAWALEAGNYRVVLCVASANDGAARFYERLGFTFTGAESGPFGPQRMFVRHMVRSLRGGSGPVGGTLTGG